MVAVESYMHRVHNEFPELNGLRRLRELILYVSAMYREDTWFGATRLNKVLYEADHEAYRRFGMPITGIVYVKEKQGPVPREMGGILHDMHAEGLINIRQVPHPLAPNRKLRRVEPEREADLTFMSIDTRHVLDGVIMARWGESADSASARTHGIAWEIANMRDPIPYEAAFLSDRSITQKDIERTEELSRRFGWGSY
jgi:Protein of unknown function (DUF4065)